MSDQTLLLFGTGITFIFAAGVYVFVRERFERGLGKEAIPVESRPAPLRKAGHET